MTQKAQSQKLRWLKANRGVLSRIAEALSLSKQFVNDVYWEKKRSGGRRVERELAKAGAPGFDGHRPNIITYPDLALDVYTEEPK